MGPLPPATAPPLSARLPRALGAAFSATLPIILGAALGNVSMGFSASFGAYLVTVTHPVLPARGGGSRIGLTVAMLSLGATVGAISGMRIWTFLPLAIALAAWQALTEVAATGLRLPAAMSVLAALLSCGNVGEDLPAGEYAAAFAVGAVWQGAVQFACARSPRASTTTFTADLAALGASWRPARRFAGVMAAAGLIGGGVAAALPVPHAVWLLTAALRVMRPQRETTWQRLQQRFAGTAAGALIAASLLAVRLPALLHGAIVAVALTAMQLVGARRYALWTCCLTVIALDLGTLPQNTGWGIAAGRLLLTIGGLALAALFAPALP